MWNRAYDIVIGKIYYDDMHLTMFIHRSEKLRGVVEDDKEEDRSYHERVES